MIQAASGRLGMAWRLAAYRPGRSATRVDGHMTHDLPCPSPERQFFFTSFAAGVISKRPLGLAWLTVEAIQAFGHRSSHSGMRDPMTRPTTTLGLLGDTASRDYADKLRLFNAFAAPQIRQAIASLALKPGMRILDAGCGTGEALAWLADDVGPDGAVIGMDLATPHVRAAHSTATESGSLLLQGNILALPMVAASVDLVWSVNVINHLRSPVAGLQALMALVRPGGRVALGQSSLLPDMYFAWDSRLERLVNEAVRQYYRDRYQLDERDLTSIRAIAGLLRQAGLRDVHVRTFMIERLAPLRLEDENYLLNAIFRGTWGSRLQAYLSSSDHEEVMRLCDPNHPDYALRRPDFHFLQSFTLAVGVV